MSNDDQYALNWSHHGGHIRKAFQSLFQRDEFVDVTLSCEGKKIKAHRIILSACSTYFHDLLQDNPCPHPIIILRDFKYENIENIIMFMYNGEVQVPTENFGSFLKTAETLEVCGLTGDSQTKEFTNAASVKDKDESEAAVVKEKVKPGPASKKLEREQRKLNENKKRSNDEEVPQHKKKKGERQETKDEEGSDVEFDLPDTPKLSEPRTRQKINHMQELLGGDVSYLTKESNPECECPICAQKFTSMYLLKEHVPFHMGETKCQYCGSTFARRDILKKHQINVHKIHPNV